MRHFGMFLVLTAVVSVTGCGQSAPRGGIAVVDLDKVAAETGRTRQLEQSLGVAQSSLNQELTKYYNEAKDKLDTKKKQLGDSTEDLKQYAELERAESVKLNQIKTVAQNKLAQFNQKQIADFRDELKPIAQEVAAKRGLGIVIPKNPGILLSVDPGVDITDEVIKVAREKLRVAPAAVTEAPANRQAPATRNSSARTAARPDADEEEESTR